MKLIQRYAVLNRAYNIAAGTYTGSNTIDPTIKFNLIVNSLNVSSQTRDNVTGQNIEGSYSIVWNLGSGAFLESNPGIDVVAAFRGNIGNHFSNGWVHIDCYQYCAQYSTQRFTCAARLNTVTANAINHEFRIVIGYLCPEDYLSMDGLAAKPL